MKWTQEQIDEKAAALFECGMGFGVAWDLQKEVDKEYWRKKVLAAQMPISEVTSEEWLSAAKSTHPTDGNLTALEITNRVIARRNGPPKPDLRERIIDAIDDVLTEDTGNGKAYGLADRILAIVKEETK